MSQSTQNILSKIQNDYAQELADLNNIAQNEQKLSNDQTTANNDLNNEHYTTSHWSILDMGESTGNVHTRQSVVNAYNSMEGHINSINSEITHCEGNLESLDASSSLKDLLGALNGIDLGTSVTIEQKGVAATANEYLNERDLKDAINTLVTMIQQQLQIDENLSEASAGVGGSGESLDMLVIQEEAKQSGEFNSLSNVLLSSLSTYTNEEGAAQVAEHGSDAITQAVGSFGWNDSNSKIRDAERHMRQASRALQAVVSAQQDLSKVGADMANYAFSSTLLAVDNILQEVQKILSDPKLSTKEKEAKLAQCLQLLLGFVQIVLQTAENLRAKNSQKMNKANIEAQKLNLQKMKYISQEFAEVEKQEHEMKICQKVLMGVEIAASIALAVSGSIGVAAAMLAMTIADATGATQHWTDDMANDLNNDGAKNSKLDADAIMMGISVLGTMGAGAAIDQLVARVTSAIVNAETQAVVQASDMLIKEAAEKATSKAIEEVGGTVSDAVKEQAEQAAYNTIKETAEKAAQTAAQNAAKTFSKRSVADLVALRVRKSVTTEMTRAIQRSVEEAVKVAVKDASDAAVNAAKTTISSATNAAAVQTATQVIAESTIREIVSNAAGKAIDTIVNAAKSIGKNENFRSALWAGVYTTASTNMLVDIATGIYNNTHGKHKISKKEFEEIVETCMEIVQMLMQAIAMLKGGGFMDQAMSSDPNPVLRGAQAASSIAMIGSQMGQTSLNYQQYYTLEKQAEAVKELGKTEAYISFLRSYMDDQNKNATQSNPEITTEEKRLAQEQLWLSAHMWDGMEAGCKILAAKSI